MSIDQENEIRDWIHSLVGETFEEGCFAAGLKDGILLGRLMNKVQPGSVPSNIQPPGNNNFKKAENITMFIRACRKYGVPEMDLFETVDLLEERGLRIVAQCILALKRECLSRSQNGSPDKGDRLQRVSSSSWKMRPVGSPLKHQSSNPETSGLEEVTHILQQAQMSSSSGLTTTNSELEAGLTSPSVSKSTSIPVNSTGSGPVGKRGGGFGLDAEIAARLAAKYDIGAEQEAQCWMEEVIGEEFPGDFVGSLKNGVLLCKLINSIKPGTIKKINENTALAFKLMDNITNFIRGCRLLGVPEHDIFDTIDLYEEKDVGLVVQTIHALGRTIQVTVPEFTGPTLGPRLAQRNERVFTEEQLRKARLQSQMTGITAGSQGIMERSEVSKHGSVTFGAEMAGIGDTSVQSQWSKGSQGIMERLGVDTSRSVTYGAENAGIGDTSVQSQWSKGSQGIMERLGVDTSRSITYGAENAGIGDTCVESKWSKGSQGIMERLSVDTSRSITYGAENAGIGDTYVQAQWSKGSQGIMERLAVDTSRSITYGAENTGRMPPNQFQS